MTTSITLTGTGVPHTSPGRAGPGVLVRHGTTALQFDAGRATTLRLAEVGIQPARLTAVFITHIHSDHVVGLADLAMTRWLEAQLFPAGPLPIVAHDGVVTRFVQRMFDVYDDDIASRTVHVQEEPPRVDLQTFVASSEPATVWTNDDGDVTVSAVSVHHEPVPEAVAYRVDTPDGAVIISGDTQVCDEVKQLSTGASVLVHEAARTRAVMKQIAGTPIERIFSYHADSVALGESAQRAGVPHLLLTHLIPAPPNEAAEALFEQDVREGGYTGKVTVGRDLVTVELPEPAQP